MEEYKGFKIGDTIEITERPVYWASLLSENKPLDVVKYPFTTIIEELKDDGDYVAMKCSNNYGWDFSHLIKKGIIKKVKQEFVLPKKWCIIHHKEVADYIIGLIGHNRGNYYENLKLYSHFPPMPTSKGDGYCFENKQKGYTEITFQQFKEYVLKRKDMIPERISFYVKYTLEFTEDLYNKLMDWSIKNSKGTIRGYADSYQGLIRKGYFVFDNWGLHRDSYFLDVSPCYSYGVDNNPQTCKTEYSVQQIKKIILKEPMERELAKPFRVDGSKSLIIAFYNELLNLGYEKGTYTPDNREYVKGYYVATNINLLIETTLKESYLKLYYGGVTKIPNPNHANFQLPQQWDEALEFAKSQLDDKYWVKPVEKEAVSEKPVVEVGKFYEFNWDWAGKDKKIICKCNKFVKRVEERDHLGAEWYVSTYNNNRVFTEGGFNMSEISQLKEITKEEIQQYLPKGHKDKIIDEKQLLLEEAKRRYPIGTKFISSMTGTDETDEYEVKNTDFYWWRGTDIVVNVNLGPSVYTKGKWAEIINPVVELPQYEPKDKYKVGDYVTVFRQKHPVLIGMNTHYDIGFTFQIVSTAFYKETCYFPHVGIGVYQANLRPATTEEYINSLPDYVKIINTDKYNYGKSYGNIQPVVNKIYKVVKDNSLYTFMSNPCERLVIYALSEGNSSKITFLNPLIGVDFVPATKEEYEPATVALPFGNLTFIVSKENQNITCQHGIITAEQVKMVYDLVHPKTQLLGYDLKLTTSLIKFGCCEGSVEELDAIYNALNE